MRESKASLWFSEPSSGEEQQSEQVQEPGAPCFFLSLGEEEQIQGVPFSFKCVKGSMDSVFLHIDVALCWLMFKGGTPASSPNPIVLIHRPLPHIFLLIASKAL